MIDQDVMRALAAKLRDEYEARIGITSSRYRDAVSKVPLQAANAIDALLAELEAAAADKRILNQQIIGAQAARERYVQILSAIHGLLQPQDVKLEDGRVMRFSKPDLQIECYRQLSERIRAIPDELAALAQRQEQS